MKQTFLYYDFICPIRNTIRILRRLRDSNPECLSAHLFSRQADYQLSQSARTKTKLVLYTEAGFCIIIGYPISISLYSLADRLNEFLRYATLIVFTTPSAKM